MNSLQVFRKKRLHSAAGRRFGRSAADPTGRSLIYETGFRSEHPEWFWYFWDHCENRFCPNSLEFFLHHCQFRAEGRRRRILFRVWSLRDGSFSLYNGKTVLILCSVYRLYHCMDLINCDYPPPRYLCVLRCKLIGYSVQGGPKSTPLCLTVLILYGFDQMNVICISQGTVATFYRWGDTFIIVWCDISSAFCVSQIAVIGSFSLSYFKKKLEAIQRWSAICRVWPWTLIY